LCEILQTGSINEFMEKTECLTADLVRFSHVLGPGKSGMETNGLMRSNASAAIS
jgi:hypothetical protein